MLCKSTDHVCVYDLPEATSSTFDECHQYAHRTHQPSTRKVCEKVERECGFALPREHLPSERQQRRYHVTVLRRTDSTPLTAR